MKKELKDMTIAELKEEAKKYPEITGVGSMNKQPLLEAVEAAVKAVDKKEKKNERLTPHKPTINKMVSGEDRAVCPLEVDGKLCGHKKEADHLICGSCNKKYGWPGRNIVSKAISRVKNYIDPVVFAEVVSMAKMAIENDSSLDDEVLADVLREKPEEGNCRENFSDLPRGGVIGSVRKARRELAEAKEQAEKDAKHQAKWEAAIKAVETAFPKETRVQPDQNYFRDNPAEYDGKKISDSMIRAACKEVWSERYPDWRKHAFDFVKEIHKEDASGRRIDPGYFQEVEFWGKRISEGMFKAAGHAVIDERKKDKARQALNKNRKFATLGDAIGGKLKGAVAPKVRTQ